MHAIQRRHLLLTGAALLGPGALRAQGDKPLIKVLVGFRPGGATDSHQSGRRPSAGGHQQA